jgi:hypothetical protein
MNRHPHHGVHGHLAGPESAVAATLDLLALRVPRETVAARLREGEPERARELTKAALFLVTLLGAMFSFVAWEVSGPRLAGMVAAAFLAALPLALLLARRGASRASARWQGLSWGQSVSYLCRTHGLVVLTPEALALQWRDKPGDGGVIWKAAWIKAVSYDPGPHALRVETIKVTGAHSASWQERYHLPLPGQVPRGQGEVLADLFHMLWTQRECQPSEAARAWLADRA